MEKDERQTHTARRKSEHIDICLHGDVRGQNVTTGFEKYRLRHTALPEIDFSEISLAGSFLGKRIKVPLVVSSMTGGTPEAAEINERLATVAEQRGWAMGLGSMRAALEEPELVATFQVRKQAPTIPIFANLGAVQLNYGYGLDHCRRAVQLVEADGLVLHLNSLQEVFQPEGNTNFKGLLSKIEQLCHTLDVPVGVKEVGWGIGGELAAALAARGVQFIDVAGAGGTSWSQVEKYRSRDPVRSLAAESFAGWGLPTATCIREVHTRVREVTVIGSGGIQNGVEAAKALALGADLVGVGRPLLAAAVHSRAALSRVCARIELELQTAMFGVGASDVQQLKTGNYLVECD
ncbi:type 2 isopentenyl-diphosphate Delta-isomerase [Numidum massiliense]|uniref:type 2 isopentenyl-diphosphate Delta-isomerase n=1 Tax=Numidum massiliense TaxID=1522315 RepID=UPI0006D57C4D|nr:type 2 isopentenyl-diphosphate Delta-isomerase [Numidum massiliense]